MRSALFWALAAGQAQVCLLQAGLRAPGRATADAPLNASGGNATDALPAWGGNASDGRFAPAMPVGMHEMGLHVHMMADIRAGLHPANMHKACSSLAKHLGLDRVDKRTAGWVLTVALGLLASSCCLLQLIVFALAGLQVFSFIPAGCWGFKKYLGPMQPYLRVLTLTGLALAWGTSADEMTRACLFRQTVVCLVLTFLPELLNLAGAKRLLPENGSEVLSLSVQGMSCEACAYTVRRALESTPGVRAAYVDYKHGAQVLVSHHFDRAVAAAKLDEVGFDLEEK